MAFARLGAKLSWKVIASFPEVVSEPGGLHANVIGVNSKLACNHQERTNLFRLRQLWFVSRLVVVLRQSLIYLLLPPLPALYCAPARYLKGTMVIGEMIVSREVFPLTGGRWNSSDGPTHFTLSALVAWFFVAHEGAITSGLLDTWVKWWVCTMWWLRSSRCVAKSGVDCD